MLAALLGLVPVACASAKATAPMFLDPVRWEEEVRKRGVDPREVPNPLFVTEPMRDEAARLAGWGTGKGRLERLQLALFDPEKFPFSYEVKTTLTAAEAFHRRQGNCLSFTNLFIAMARSLKIPVTMGLVTRMRSSEKEGDLIVVNNHVIAVYTFEGTPSYYDFDRTREQRPAELRILDDLWITALYLNNRGADELRAGRPEPALRYFANAVKLAPDFAFAWGNLGVARRRLHDIDGAFAAYQRALAIDAANPTILSNLAAVYRALGKETEALNALEAARMSSASPHVLLVRGDLELSRGNIAEALRFYKKARRVARQLPDAHVAIARAELARARPAAARKSLERALRIDPDNAAARTLLAASTPPGGPTS